MDRAIATLLRTGVLLSVAVVTIGMTISFVHHPEHFSSRPVHGPSTIGEVLVGLRAGNGEAIVMAGLLLLIATPVARVAFSIVVFTIERDRLYLLITMAVLLTLLGGFAIGVT